MIRRTLLLFLMIRFSLHCVRADDWPQWRGPERTGISKETGLLQSWPPEGPKLLWTLRDAGLGLSSMCVVGDRLYSMGGEGDKEYVYAIDLKTQKKLWSTEVGDIYAGNFGQGSEFGHGPQSTPTIDGNFVYAISGLGNLVCIETASGRKVWSQELKRGLGGVPTRYGYCESPLVDGDQVVVTPGGKKGAMAAFDKTTGTLKWHSDACPNSSAAFSSIIAIEVNGVRQYVQIPGGGYRDYSKSKTMVGVRASDGKPLWSFPLPSSMVIGTPVYKNDCVYICSAPGHSSSLTKLIPDGDKFKTEQVYETDKMRNSLGGAILLCDYLYGYHHISGYAGTPGSLICQDFKTGKVVWNRKEDRRLGLCGDIAFADGNLYCCHQFGDMLLIKATPTGYKIQGKFHIPEKTKLPRHGAEIWTHPVVSHGKLYLRDQDLIFCYDIRKSQR